MAVIATGEDKAPAVARAIEGPLTPKAVPVQLARRGTWFLDLAAAALLTSRRAHVVNCWRGDIGGTNARLAIVEMNGLRASFVQQKTYPSRSYPGLAPIVRAFCETAATRPERACIAIACPVIDGECTAPNLPWKVSASTLAAEIEIPRTTIINDSRRGRACGIELLGPSDLATLQEGKPDAAGADRA